MSEPITVTHEQVLHLTPGATLRVSYHNRGNTEDFILLTSPFENCSPDEMRLYASRDTLEDEEERELAEEIHSRIFFTKVQIMARRTLFVQACIEETATTEDEAERLASLEEANTVRYLTAESSCLDAFIRHKFSIPDTGSSVIPAIGVAKVVKRSPLVDVLRALNCARGDCVVWGNRDEYSCNYDEVMTMPGQLIVADDDFNEFDNWTQWYLIDEATEQKAHDALSSLFDRACHEMELEPL